MNGRVAGSKSNQPDKYAPCWNCGVVPLRRCIRCSEMKEATGTNFSSTLRNGYRIFVSYCRPCQAEVVREGSRKRLQGAKADRERIIDLENEIRVLRAVLAKENPDLAAAV